MTDQKWREKAQIILGKLALGVKLTVTEKKFLIRYRAHEVIARDRARRAA